MDDHPNRIRGDFIQRINQVRQEAEHLLHQAREIHGLLGQIREPSGRLAEAEPAGEEPFGPSGEGLYRPAGMPYLLEALNRSLGELEAWSQKISGREEDLKQALQGLEVRAEDLAGQTASLGETLALKAASLPRLAVLARELATGRHFLKRDQEELAGAVSEAIGLLEQKEQGRRQLLDLARTTLIQGEKKQDHLQEILANQKTLAEHLETCGKWLERTFEVYEAGPPGFQTSSGAWRDKSKEAQDLVEGLRRFHQGLQPLVKINVDSLIRVLTERVKAPTPEAEERPDPGGAPPGIPGGSPGTTPLPPDLEMLLDTVNSLNEQMNLLSLNAFIASVQGGKKPEELAEVFGDIRVISDRLKTEVLQFQEKVSPPASFAAETASEPAGPPRGRPAPGGGEGIFRDLEALRPACRQAGEALQELEELADRLLEHLRWFSGQFQELALLVREQTRFGGQILEGLLPLKNALGQLKTLQADQDFQVREINRSIQKTLVQAAPVRKWFADPGPGAGAPLNRVESVREIVRSLAGELFKQGQDEERLQQELERLRSLPEAVEQFLSGQTLKYLEFQEAVEKVRGDYQQMNRDLDVQQATLKTVIGQVRRLYEHLEPLVRDSREQSAMNRALLEAFTEIRSRIQEKVTG
ncbi:MAG: hypothetical protein MUF69_03490 [Desulfobacterota bacterium]|nr:hypothetical protein [Thermodesulfobacteriota bacterium]